MRKRVIGFSLREGGREGGGFRLSVSGGGSGIGARPTPIPSLHPPSPLQHSARLEETLFSGVLFVPGEEGKVRFELAVVV